MVHSGCFLERQYCTFTGTARGQNSREFVARLAVQIEALLTGELWLRNARQANAMATRLAERLEPIPGLEVAVPVETNAVFAHVPAESLEALCQATGLPVWERERSVVRMMTSFDTTKEEVDAFANGIATLLEAKP